MIKNKSKKFGIGFLILFLVVQFYPLVETAFAVDDTNVVNVTLEVTSGISIDTNEPADISLTALTPTNHSAVGSAAWTVVTNNNAGYTLTVYATTGGATEALSIGGDGVTGNIANFTTVAGDVAETWDVSNAVEFGFSAYGADVIANFTPGGDTDCVAAANVPSAGLTWLGFDSAVGADQIATSASATPVAGTVTTMCVAVEQDTIFATVGSYSAEITATATTL